MVLRRRIEFTLPMWPEYTQGTEVPLRECTAGARLQVLLEANRVSFAGEFHDDDIVC
jgi:hypothetical protein